jgi:serine protease Do
MLPSPRPLSLLLVFGVAIAAAAAAAESPSPPAREADLPRLIRAALPSVVNITILGEKPSAEGHTPQGAEAMTTPVTEVGSGFVIAPDGWIVTNRHVIQYAYKVTVTFHDRSAYPARVVATNESPDLALLKIDVPGKLKPLAWGDSSRLVVGDRVIAIGNPLGLESTVTHGIVSALNRNVDVSRFDEYIQTDAAINHGNSGGPLLDMQGQVVGVNWALIDPTSKGSIGLGLSIPSSAVRWVIEQMRAHGHADPGWLGVGLQPLTQDIVNTLGVASFDGGLVNEIVPGSSAATVLRLGDLILDVNGQHATDTRALTRDLAMNPPGSQVTLGIRRDGRRLQVQARMQDWPPGPGNPVGNWTMPSRGPRVSEPHLGMQLEPLTDAVREKFHLPPATAGVVVVSVAANSPGADAGFKAGDVITQINDRPIITEADVHEAATAARAAHARSVLTLVRNEKGAEWLAVPIDAH